MKNNWRETDRQKRENQERESRERKLADIEREREGGEMFWRVEFSCASSFRLCSY